MHLSKPRTVVVTVEELFPGTGSGIVPADTETVLEIKPPAGAFAFTAMAKTTLAPGANGLFDLNCNLPEPPSGGRVSTAKPGGGATETKLVPTGRSSVTTTVGAASLPLLLRATVY